MALSVLLIHSERSNASRYRQSLLNAEPAIRVAMARTLQEVKQLPVPEVILLDLSLGQPSSFEILEWLRSAEAYIHVPVIALGSPHTADRIDQAYQLGANACLMETEDGGLQQEVARGIGSYARVLSRQTV